MTLRFAFILLLFFPALSHSQVSQGNILAYIPPIIAAASNQKVSYSVGTALSYNPGRIDINNKFNSWGITQPGSERQQIILKVYEKIGEYNVPAQWALAIRTQPNPVGTLSAEDMEIKLMSNYTFNSDLCCINTIPFSAFDQAGLSFIGVSGFVNFANNYSGTFEVGFQQLEDFGRGISIATGDITTVAGCWHIALEGGTSGCDL